MTPDRFADLMTLAYLAAMALALCLTLRRRP